MPDGGFQLLYYVTSSRSEQEVFTKTQLRDQLQKGNLEKNGTLLQSHATDSALVQPLEVDTSFLTNLVRDGDKGIHSTLRAGTSFISHPKGPLS